MNQYEFDKEVLSHWIKRFLNPEDKIINYYFREDKLVVETEEV